MTTGAEADDLLRRRVALERAAIGDLAKLVAAISTTCDGLESCFQLIRLTSLRAAATLAELDAQLDQRGKTEEILRAEDLAAEIERDLLASGLDRRKRAFERLCIHGVAMVTGRANDPTTPAAEPCSLEACDRAGDLQIAVTGDEVDPPRTVRVCIPHGRAVAYKNAAVRVSKAASQLIGDSGHEGPPPEEVTS